MGHLEALRGERLHTAGHQPESGVALVLDRGLEQELDPETDPPHGHPRLESLPDERGEAELALAATARKNSSVSSASNPAIETGGRSASNTHSGLPEMSIAHMPSASSIGTAM